MFEKKEDKVETKVNAAVETKVNAAVETKGEGEGEGKVLTDDELKAKKKNEASKKMIARKKAAIAVLKDLANRLGTPEEKTAAAYLSGEGRAPGVARAAAVSYITLLFKDNVGATISEGDVFKNTKMGRLEMRALIKKEVNRGNWISFDAVKEIYTFVAKGTEAPAGWNGPMPKVAKL